MPAALVTLTSFTKTGITRSTNANLLTDVAAMSALTLRQLKALQIYFYMNALYSFISSLDYRTDLSTLRANSALLTGSSSPVGLPGIQMEAALTAIAYQNALSSSTGGSNTTTISTDIPTILALDPVPHLARYSVEELDRYLLTLKYLFAINL